MNKDIEEILDEYVEVVLEKLKEEPLTDDWVERIMFFNTVNLIDDLTDYITKSNREAVEGFYKWYKEHPVTMSKKPMTEQYWEFLFQLNKEEECK